MVAGVAGAFSAASATTINTYSTLDLGGFAQRIYILNGTLGPRATVSTAAPAGYAFKGIGDYFGTGVSGVLWQNTTTGDTQIWGFSNDQVVQQTSPGLVAPSSGWSIVS